MDKNEKKIIIKAQNGDMDSFEELVKIHQKNVLNLAYRMVLNLSDAEDITQDVFVKLFKYIGNFKFNSSLSTFLYKITVNTCKDFFKKSNKNKKIIPIEQDDYVIEIKDEKYNPEDIYVENEIADDLNFYLSKLDLIYREVIILKEIKGYKYKEISKILDINVGTVKSRINRAKKLLVNYLEEDEYEI